MPSALHQLVESVTDTYTVVAEHPRPGDIRPSVWEVEGLVETGGSASSTRARNYTDAK